MAQLTPSQLPSLREDAGLFRELDVLERLRAGLPDGYEIFHEVLWHSIHDGMDKHGEIDIVVLGPSGDVLLMEVKAGQVLLREGGIFKRYGQQERDVARQCKIQYAGMVSRLKAAGLHPWLVNCLVLPDYRLESDQVVSIPRERIIDANEYGQLATRVQALLAARCGKADVGQVRRFLRNEFQVSPSIATLRDQLRGATHRLSDGLATWAPRISHTSGTMRIQATAGSGKTQLALALLEAASASKDAALYVCYNRSLADLIGAVAPVRTEVTSFHELAIEHFRRHHHEPDFGNAEIFQQAVEAFEKDSGSFAPRYDLLIVDEGQDFEPGWVASLLNMLKPTGRLYFMEDAQQRLYEREPFDFDDAVTLTCHDNFRSPRAICQTINALGLVSPPVTSKSPYQGELPEFLPYDSDAAMIEQTMRAVKSLLEQGYALADIVILTGAGRSRSKLLNATSLGNFSLRHFTGAYSTAGTPVWSEGELVVESIYRFKGQSAPAVVLTELNFSELTEQVRRKLFVGMTRAQLALQIVLSTQAEAACASRLD